LQFGHENIPSGNPALKKSNFESRGQSRKDGILFEEEQGDQIGQFFAHRASKFRPFSENYRSGPKNL
jgi:hypothetical protein